MVCYPDNYLESGKIDSLELFRRVARIRYAELCIAEHYHEQRMRCPVHLCTGQEGIAAGLSAAMQRGDKLYASHRSHGAYIASGGALEPFFAELLGKDGGVCGGRGGSMHLMSPETDFQGAVPILGDSIALATGCALAMQMRGDKSVTAVLFGDGACEEGIFSESLQFAASRNLPIIYVCENNGVSVNTPWSKRRQEGFRLSTVAAAYGLSTYSGDGNNPLEVAWACRTAIENARTGKVPTFLEFFTVRWQEHCGPREEIFPLVQGNQKFFPWQKKCPLEHMRLELLQEGVNAKNLADIEDEERRHIEGAWQIAEKAPDVAASGGEDHIYAPRGDKSGY